MSILWLAQDYRRVCFKGISQNFFFGVLFAILANPGFRALFIFRVQQSANKIRPQVLGRSLAFFISSFNQFLTGAEFMPGCEIGPGCVIRHPTGIVIGSGVKIGPFSTIQHGVTIGVKYIQPEYDQIQKYPTLGEFVSLGTNSVILGDIHVGDNCTIGANCVLSKSLESNSTYV